MSTAPLSKRHQIVDGKRVAFHERGAGDVPMGILRELRDEDMAEYRRPCAARGEDRRPILS
jgi:hypothetical protein